MSYSPEPTTRTSLLRRLRTREPDEEAWRQLVRRYGRLIYSWCRAWRLQEADAEDVTQTVLTTLAVRLRTFEYDPAQRFRGWLLTVTRNAWAAFVSSQAKAQRGGDSANLRLLATVEAREDLAARLEKEFDQELLEIAMDRVRQRVEPHTWEAFYQTAIELRPAVEVAGRLGIQVATVYVARSKVQKRIREELSLLEGGEGP